MYVLVPFLRRTKRRASSSSTKHDEGNDSGYVDIDFVAKTSTDFKNIPHVL